jgi:cell wall-associated NlpC family hydrolase
MSKRSIVTARQWTTTATLALVIVLPAAAPLVPTLGERLRGEPATSGTTRNGRMVKGTQNGAGYVRAPQPVSVTSGTSRLTRVFVRPGQRVKRGQLLARAESASLRRRLRSAETALRNARTRLDWAKRRATERDRHAQVSAAQALAVRNEQVAVEARRKEAEAKTASLERRISGAQQRLTEARRSAEASEQRLRAAAEQAQRSLERARRATSGDKARLDRSVAEAKRSLAQAQALSRASNERRQGAVEQAQQAFDAAKASQAQNAQGYQSAVAQAQQALTDAENALTSDQDTLSSARSDRDDAEDEVRSHRKGVDDLQSKVDADKAALDACTANPPAEGCATLQASHHRDAAKLKDEQSRLETAESNLANAKSTVSSLEDTLASDQAALSSAQGSLATAQQAQTSGEADDDQRVQAAQEALASAQASATSGASESETTVLKAKQTLDSASSTRDARLSHDQQSLAGAQASLTRTQGKLASSRRGGDRALQSARQGLRAAQTSRRSTVAKTEQEVAAAAASLRDAQQSLSSALGSNTSFVNAPTASDLTVAETKVELAKLLMASAREHLTEASELRAPASGRVAAVKPAARSSDPGSGSISLTDLESLQVKVSYPTGDAAGIQPGQPATVTLPAAPETKLAAHVISVGPALTAADGTSTREVTFALDRNDPDAKPGMTAEAEVVPEPDHTAARLKYLRRRLAAEEKIAVEGHAGIVGIATRYLGVPYVWGGESPTGGFDCSGLVKYVYAQVGVSLPHYAAAQYNYGLPVSRDQLEPGDLVFFDALGHVGIYIGNDEFIQAPHTGDVVKISSLDDATYALTYVGARRLPGRS